jgi:hypothetical protein
MPPQIYKLLGTMLLICNRMIIPRFIIDSVESENPLPFLKKRGTQRLSKPLHCCKILVLNQRVTGLTPVRPTGAINDPAKTLFSIKSVIDLFQEIARLGFPVLHKRG